METQVSIRYTLSFMRFDPGLGVLTATVDPNGLATRWAHDGLGRITKELPSPEKRRPAPTRT